jgi:hypothetical protein
MPVMPFVDLLKDYVRAFFHLKKQPTIDKMRMRVVIVREKSDQKPIQVVQFISGTPAEPV